MQSSMRGATLLAMVCCLGQTAVGGALKGTRSDDGSTVVAGDHFRLTVDPRRGGELIDIQLFDGSRWNRVLGADGQTTPAVQLRDADAEYRLAHDDGAQLGPIEQAPGLIRFESTGIPKTADGRAGPWTVKLRYQVYAEGALFLDLEYALPRGEVVLTDASLSFAVDRALTQCPHFRTANPMKQHPGFDSGRVAFGIILAYETYSYKHNVQVLAADPDAPSNRWILPYWRLLGAIDMSNATVYNLPSVNVVAATCSKPEFQCLVYQQDPDTYLVIVANLGKTPGQAEIALDRRFLGLRREYQLSRVDAATGQIAPRGVCTTRLTTSQLPPWGIEGFKLHRAGSTSGQGELLNQGSGRSSDHFSEQQQRTGGKEETPVTGTCASGVCKPVNGRGPAAF